MMQNTSEGVTPKWLNSAKEYEKEFREILERKGVSTENYTLAGLYVHNVAGEFPFIVEEFYKEGDYFMFRWRDSGQAVTETWKYKWYAGQGNVLVFDEYIERERS